VDALRFAGERAADEITEAPQDEGDETLRGTAHPLIGFVVNVKLAGDKKEIVADAMKEDGGEDEDRAKTGVVHAPGEKSSSLCFGGPKLDQFFVTTAGGVPGSASADGSVYHWSAGVSGPPEFRSRIGL
jgi:hypothetical protein